MSWYTNKPYVPVAERRRKGQVAAKRLAKKHGRPLDPVELATKQIATTFWGKAWCANLEAYSDYSNRLPRGRTYVRNGSVLDLQIATGKVEALVQGSALYKVAITFKALSGPRWKQFKTRSAGKLTNLLDLLQGKLSKEILADITARDSGLFPAPKEIKLACSCPDWADMCKHVAAVLYGVGARLDSRPELFFSLRGVDVAELISAASASAVTPLADAAPSAAGLEDSSLSELFGVDIEVSAPPITKPVKRAKKKLPAKSAKPAVKTKAARKTTKRKSVRAK